MMTADNLAMLTDPQVDRILDMVYKIIVGIGGFMSVALPALILHFQRRNVSAVTKEIAVNKELSVVATTTANDTNTKIAKLAEELVELRKQFNAAQQK
jgi:hypothetical protein